MKVCGYCTRYSKNITGCNAQNLCHADMMDNNCQEWFVRREPMHECHRPNDFTEVDGGLKEKRQGFC